MSLTPPPSDSAARRVGQQVADDALRRFGEAVALLGRDSDYIVRSLTEMLLAMAPISMEKLTENEVCFLIESGTFTAEEWAKTSASVNRGSLQFGAAEVGLFALFETESMETVTGFLSWNEDAVRASVSEGRLYAIELSGQLRFPTWQFDVGSPTKLLPGLAEIIRVITPRWRWQIVAGFMSTPQSSLVAEGRKTPVEWLRDGGAISEVTQIVEAGDWW